MLGEPARASRADASAAWRSGRFLRLQNPAGGTGVSSTCTSSQSADQPKSFGWSGVPVSIGRKSHMRPRNLVAENTIIDLKRSIPSILIRKSCSAFLKPSARRVLRMRVLTCRARGSVVAVTILLHKPRIIRRGWAASLKRASHLPHRPAPLLAVATALLSRGANPPPRERQSRTGPRRTPPCAHVRSYGRQPRP